MGTASLVCHDVAKLQVLFFIFYFFESSILNPYGKLTMLPILSTYESLYPQRGQTRLLTSTQNRSHNTNNVWFAPLTLIKCKNEGVANKANF